jgi:2,4-dienoyl-CoA reductase-like NADH-dependent reductase (Old Yellow Enzyme family)
MTKKLTDKVTFRHGATVNNRIVQSPMQSFSGLENGFVSDETLAHYSRHSETGGMAIVEYTQVSEEGGSNSMTGWPVQLAIYSDEHIDGLSKVAKSLKADRNKAIIQLHHAGREATLRGESGQSVYGPSAIDFEFLDYPVEELSTDHIKQIVQDFYDGTVRAIKAGFDGVEIHGANHYLLQQFVSEISNQRTDEYGGTLENRFRFPLEVTQAVKQAVKDHAPDDFIIGYRISPEEIHEGTIGYTYKESLQLIEEIVKLELDYIHLSVFGKYHVGPEGVDQSYGELFADVLDDETKLVIIGSVFSEEDAQGALNHGDLVAIARAALIDPDFGKKIEEGRGDEIFQEVIPARVTEGIWPRNLLKAFQTPSIGLMPLPNFESIEDMEIE